MGRELIHARAVPRDLMGRAPLRAHWYEVVWPRHARYSSVALSASCAPKELEDVGTAYYASSQIMGRSRAELAGAQTTTLQPHSSEIGCRDVRRTVRSCRACKTSKLVGSNTMTSFTPCDK